MLYPDWLNSEYYKKVMQQWGYQKDAQHSLNTGAWAFAQQCKLRASKRNR
jgi:hypothetical protein